MADTNAPITDAKRIELVSLFCGAGGLDMGFENAGFRTIWANDILPEACETHRNWSDSEVICEDIRNIDVSTIPQAKVVVGGFPCQGLAWQALERWTIVGMSCTSSSLK